MKKEYIFYIMFAMIALFCFNFGVKALECKYVLSEGTKAEIEVKVDSTTGNVYVKQGDSYTYIPRTNSLEADAVKDFKLESGQQLYIMNKFSVWNDTSMCGTFFYTSASDNDNKEYYMYTFSNNSVNGDGSIPGDWGTGKLLNDSSQDKYHENIKLECKYNGLFKSSIRSDEFKYNVNVSFGNGILTRFCANKYREICRNVYANTTRYVNVNVNGEEHNNYYVFNYDYLTSFANACEQLNYAIDDENRVIYFYISYSALPEHLKDNKYPKGQLFDGNLTQQELDEYNSAHGNNSIINDGIHEITPDNPGEDVSGCEGLIGENTLKFLKGILNLIMIVGPILAFVLGAYDIAVAIASGEEDAKKKGIKKMKNRLIAAVILLLLPALVEFILNFFNRVGTNCL